MADDEAQEYIRQIQERKPDYREIKTSCKKVKSEVAGKMEAYNRLLDRKKAMTYERDRRNDELQDLTKELEVQSTFLSKAQPGKAKQKNDSDNHATPQMLRAQENYKTSIERYVLEDLNEALAKKFKKNKDNDEGDVVVEEHAVYQKPLNGAVVAVLYEQTDIYAIDKEGDGPIVLPPTNFYYTTFRMKSKAYFEDLKIAAASHWNIPKKEWYRVEIWSDKEKITNLKSHLIEKYIKGKMMDAPKLCFTMKIKPQSSGKHDDDHFDEKEDDNKKEQIKQLSSYELFAERMPKLTVPLKYFIDSQNYIKIDDHSKKEADLYRKRWSSPTTFGDNHICILTIIILILVSLTKEWDFSSTYEKVRVVHEVLKIDELREVTKPKQLIDVLINIAQFFSDHKVLTETDLKLEPVQLSVPILIRIYNVMKTECAHPHQNITCYHKYYNQDTREIEDIVNQGTRYILQMDADESTIYSGIFGDYSLQAYKVFLLPQRLNAFDFSVKSCNLFANTGVAQETCRTRVTETCNNINCSLTELNDWLTEFSTMEYNLINQSTRAFSISFDLVDSSTKQFFHFEPLIEITPLGVMAPRIQRIIPYFVDWNSRPIHGVANAFLGIFATLLLFFLLFSIFATGKGVNLGYFYELPGLLNFISIVTTFMSIARMNQLDGLSLDYNDVINPEAEIDYYLEGVAKLYESGRFFRAICTGILLMRALLVFKLGSRVEIITAAFERGIPNTAKFIVAIALPYALMHAYVSQVFFGKENSDYYNFGQALVATVSTAISVTNNDYPIRDWKGVIYILMGLFTIFLMVPMYTMAIYSEGYRMTVMDYGDEFHTKYVWKSLEWYNWLLGWLPARLKKYTDKIMKGSEEALKMGANLNNLKKFAKGAEKISLKKKLQNCKKSWQDLRNNTKKMLNKVKGQKNENKVVHKIRLSSYNPSTAINIPRESR